MNIISHRGESKYAPENTMGAFYLAEFINSDGIECDIRKTKDDVLVLIHDKTINRTSNYKGKVSDYTYKELLKFDFGNNEKIVKLTDFLNYFSNKKLKLYLEIKENGYEDKIYDEIKKYDLSNVIIISFKYSTLDKFKNINTGWLVYDINEEVVKEAKKANIDEIICINVALKKEDVFTLHKENMLVGCWGVMNKAELIRISKFNVDTIMYDSAYDAKKVLNDD